MTLVSILPPDISVRATTDISSQIEVLQGQGLTYTEAALRVQVIGSFNRHLLPNGLIVNGHGGHDYWLWMKGNWDGATTGRAIDAVTRLRTVGKQSLMPEMPADSDGNEIVNDLEPMSRAGRWWETGPQSVTLQPSGDEKIETVIFSKFGGPAVSYFENNPAQHHSPEDVSMLPTWFKDKSLGIRNRIDAFATLALVQTLMVFDDNDESQNGTRYARIAAMIRQHAHEYSPLVGQGCFVSDYETQQVRERLAKMTPDQVRRICEYLRRRGIVS